MTMTVIDAPAPRLGGSGGGSQQAPAAVVMVRPHLFAPNLAECGDNTYMTAPRGDERAVAQAAYREVSIMADRLTDRGVRVHLFEDTGRLTPDSVFPNNWFSTHDDGALTLYPMKARNRRGERRTDIVDTLRGQYAVTHVRDYSAWEQAGQYLEGTGVLVLDHDTRVAYVCRSHRVNETLLRQFCSDHGYRAVVFDAVDRLGHPIYHTNVMMAVGTDVALVCLDAIASDLDRRTVRDELEAAGRHVISLTHEQVGEFAGNALEVRGSGAALLVMSSRGWRSLSRRSRSAVDSWVDVLTVDVPTIEHAGGSARCMMAGVHLPAIAS